MAEFKKISDVDVVTELTENDNVLVIGSDGALKQTASSNVKGSTSWNDLTDKPFYEETETIEPITWDGNTEGLVEVDLGDGFKYYKVSDKVFSNEQIKMMSYSYYQTDTPIGECVCHYRDEWERLVEYGSVTDDIVLGLGVFFVRKAGVVDSNGVVYPETGVYFSKEEALEYDFLCYTTSLYAEGNAISTIKKIDEKYLPSGVTKFYLIENNGSYLHTSISTSEETRAHSSDIDEALERGAIVICYVYEDGSIGYIAYPMCIRPANHGYEINVYDGRYGNTGYCYTSDYEIIEE